MADIIVDSACGVRVSGMRSISEIGCPSCWPNSEAEVDNAQMR